MRRIFSLMLISTLAAACGPVREDVEVDWTFGGKACDAAGVATIHVDIAGEVLSPNEFTCAEASLGADLGTYLTGDYQITISGYDAGGALAYQTTQSLQVRRGGQNTFQIDVPPLPSGDVTLHWTFHGQTCAQAGITTLHVSADNEVITTDGTSPDIPCTSNGTDATTIGPFPVGTHTFDMVGVDSGGTPRYALNGFQVAIVANQTVDASPDLQPASPSTAEANMTWTFDGKSCAAAGVDTVHIYVDPNPDGSPSGVASNDLGTVPCSTMGTDGASISQLTPGNHSFAIYGIHANNFLYRTHHPPTYFFAVGLITNVTMSAESPP